MKIVTVGDNCIDYYVDLDQGFCGGNPVNVAVYARRYDVECSYVGWVGNDRWGQQMISELSKHQVDVSHLFVKEGKTALTEVKIVNHERYLGDYDEGVFQHFQLTQSDIDFISQHDVMVSGIWSHVENDLSNIHIPIAFDFADKWNHQLFENLISQIQFAFYSNDVHSILEIQDFMKQKMTASLKVMVCTRGKEGSVAYDGKDFYTYGIEPCEVVDTLGAGDSYIAGFLVSYFKDQDIQKAMQAGAKNSAMTLGYFGAW